jgi:multidrug efflux system outer membrane protein
MLVALCGALVAACASLQPPPPATAKLSGHAAVVTQDAPTGGTWPGGQWWKGYDDPVLSRLVDIAIGNGRDIAGADARLHQAREEVRLAATVLGAKVDASADYSRQRLSDNGMLPPEFLGYHWYDQLDLGISLRYQFDWWGKQRFAIESAVDRSRAVAAERQAATLILAAKVAEAYFGWLSDNARIALREQAISVQEGVLRNVQRRVAAQLESQDLATEASLQLAMQREQLEVLQGSLRLRIVTLAALTGVDAAMLPQLAPHPLPRATARLPDDVGTNLLARRPDITASRWRVEAALRDTDAARASFYPDISINALAALSSIDPGRLLRLDSAAPRLGIAVDLPLFDSGARNARHQASTAALDVAIADYDTTVADAAREAGVAAAMLQQAARQRMQREQQLASASSLVAAARARVTGQITHVGPQLAATLRELDAEDALQRVDLDALLADIQLKQALGGDPATMEIRQ